jgi:hypothetical protein
MNGVMGRIDNLITLAFLSFDSGCFAEGAFKVKRVRALIWK